jgi:hypothetical protein
MADRQQAPDADTANMPGAMSIWCYYCDKPLDKDAADPNDRPTRDHLLPRSRGGKLEPKNTVAACRRCNCHKDNMTLAEYTRYLLLLRSGYSHPQSLTMARNIFQ